MMFVISSLSRACALVAICLLAGCGLIDYDHLKTSTPSEVDELRGTPPRANVTPMADALQCLKRFNMASIGPLAVSDFTDGTGAMEGGTTQSRTFSQRTDLMMISALTQANAHLVNRSSVGVAEWELKNAMEKKLGDGQQVTVENQTVPFRPVKAGVLLGSKYYITGAITELNWNIDSVVAEGGAYSFQGGKRVYRISIAVDVMVTNTETTEVVFAKSYKKQLMGFEISTGFFRFVGTPFLTSSASNLGNGLGLNSLASGTNFEVFDANLGQKKNEPTQTALRWIVSLAGFDILRALSHRGVECEKLVAAGTRDATETTAPEEAGGAKAETSGNVASAKASQGSVATGAKHHNGREADRSLKEGSNGRPGESSGAAEPVTKPTKVLTIGGADEKLGEPAEMLRPLAPSTSDAARGTGGLEVLPPEIGTTGGGGDLKPLNTAPTAPSALRPDQASASPNADQVPTMAADARPLSLK